MKKILGIDIGTTGCKIGLFDTTGKLIKQSYRNYNLISREPGQAEQNPEEWWQNIVEGIREVITCRESLVSTKTPIGIGISCTNATVCVDKEGKPLLNAIMQLDRRANNEVDYIKDLVGEKKVFSITGNRVFPGSYSAPVILWIKNNFPDLYKKIYKFLTPTGYLVYKLTNKFTMDVTRGSTTLLMDIYNRNWSIELCNALGIDADKLPDLFFPEEIVGFVSKEAAKITGLKEGTPVIAGCMDTVSAGLGLGVKQKNNPYLIVGTVGRICYPIDIPEFDKRFMNVCFTREIPWLIMAPVNAGGLSMRWFKDNFCEKEIALSNNTGVNVYSLLDMEAELAPEGSKGLMYFPYLTGERSPIWRTDVKGTFTGITINTKKSDFIRAIMEGVSFSLKLNLDIIENFLNLNSEEIYSGGGGMLSRIWREIIANVLGKKLIIPKVVESEMLGSAIITSVGVGFYEDLSSAAKNMIDSNKTIIEPDVEKTKNYQRFYKLYKEIWERIYKN
ncbi:xylulokinase [Thermoanaerobacterium sp. DL9XJH110]|uniref:xylulokinase n=1 Tax=Thermoanaerobacterium sp. DL9XJH110 TaxID=3386643 RepID=UPI003BB7D2C4